MFLFLNRCGFFFITFVISAINGNSACNLVVMPAVHSSNSVKSQNINCICENCFYCIIYQILSCNYVVLNIL